MTQLLAALAVTAYTVALTFLATVHWTRTDDREQP